nr:reverse transcriptase domain-containing protein [Tanacetum cinerariifolium]
ANRSLCEGIKARLDERSKNWLEEISHVIWAHRTMIKSGNRETSFSLTYGTEAVIPVEIGMPTLRTTEVDMIKNNEALGINLDLLEEKREQAAIQEAKNKAKMEKYYNTRVHNTSFRPGDFVYQNNEASHAKEGGKLGPKLEGPYEVKEALGRGAYKLRGHNGSILPWTWNVCNLKKYYMHENANFWQWNLFSSGSGNNLHWQWELILLVGTLTWQWECLVHFIPNINFVEEPVEIMDREVKQLRQSRIPIIKVRWNSKRGPEYTDLSSCAGSELGSELTSLAGSELTSLAGSELGLVSYSIPGNLKTHAEGSCPPVFISSASLGNHIDSLFDEFAGELTLLKSIPSGINETDCVPEEKIRLIKRLLYDNSSPRPPEEFIFENFDTAFESFSPSHIPVEDGDSLIEEITLSFTPDDPEDIHLVERLLYDNSSPRPLEEFVSENSNANIEYFFPSPIPNEDSNSLMEEINLSYTLDDRMPSSIEDDDDDSERDILINEELLDNYSFSLSENESFCFDIPLFSHPPVKPPDGNTGILNIKMMGDIFEQKARMPRLMITRVSNQERSPDLLSHRSPEIFQLSSKCPMMIHGMNIPIMDDSDSYIEEIDLSFTLDDPMPLGIEEDDYESERDSLVLEEFLSNNSLLLPENESFHFDIPSPSRCPAKPPDGNSKILNVKVMGDISEHKVPMPRIMLTQPTLVPNKEKSPNLLSHQGHEASQPSTE